MEENEKKCELTLPNGRHIEFSYAKLKAGAAIGALLLAGAVSCAGYFYYQLADYRSEAADFAAYKQNKQEQQTKLQQLVNDNERMLRDMAEISNLEKKLRRAIIRDVDSSKLGEGTSMVDSTTAKETSANTSYTGKGGQGKLDVKGTMAVLRAQNVNIKQMLDATKKSVSELLGEVEGKSGTAATFPDKTAIIAFLTSLRFDAQLALVHIVEEQDCTKQSGFTHTLCTDEMYVAIEFDLCVWHVGTIDEYDLIEVSHLLRLRLC